MNTDGLHAALLAAMTAGDRTEENRLRWALVLSAGDYLIESGGKLYTFAVGG